MGRIKTYYTRDILKLDMARQLGYDQKVTNQDWGALTSAESGRLGGMVSGYMRRNGWKGWK